MTVVVADTSPLSYLVLIGAIDVLPKLFNRVLVPDEVIRELRATAAPPDVRAWAEALPKVGVLRAAASKGVIDLRPALEKLLQTNFRISQSLVDELLADDLRRRSD